MHNTVYEMEHLQETPNAAATRTEALKRVCMQTFYRLNKLRRATQKLHLSAITNTKIPCSGDVLIEKTNLNYIPLLFNFSSNPSRI